ncbi:MAG: hypothetical protein FJ276_22625 [Planctomycetes bacterium]|nr:hypothetical protein [Planctomycetota bacterium]
MRFHIRGADICSGQDRLLAVDAENEEEAVMRAKDLGVFPYDVFDDVRLTRQLRARRLWCVLACVAVFLIVGVAVLLVRSVT